MQDCHLKGKNPPGFNTEVTVVLFCYVLFVCLFSRHQNDPVVLRELNSQNFLLIPEHSGRKFASKGT